MRLFVSIELPEEVRDELYSRVPDVAGWRKPPASHIHLTLFFIGECSGNELSAISGQLAAIRFSPFEIMIDGFGVFPHPKQPAVLWFGVEENPALSMLHLAVRAKAGKYRETPEKKAFKPHVTVARRRAASATDEPVKKLLDKEFDPVKVTVNRFYLKQSVLKPTGSIHHRLQEFKAERD